MIYFIRKLGLPVNNLASANYWLLFERMLGLLSGLLVGVWVARYLGPSDFGLLNFALAIAATISILVKLGMDQTVIQKLIDEADRDKIIVTSVLLRLSAGLFLLFVALFVLFFAEGLLSNGKLIVIVCLGCVFQAVHTLELSHHANRQFKLVAKCKIFLLILANTIKISMILLGVEVIGFVWLFAIEQFLYSVILSFSMTKKAKLNFSILYFSNFQARKLIRSSVPLLLAGISVSLYMRVDQIMLTTMVGTEEAGFYSAAIKLVEIFYFFPLVIVATLFPRLARSLKIDRSHFEKRLWHNLRIMVFTGGAISIFLIIFSKQLIDVLYGDEYISAVKAVQILALIVPCVFVGTITTRALIAEQFQDNVFYRSISGAIINIVLNFLLIPVLGMEGAAISSIVSSFFVAFAFDLFQKNTRYMTRLKYQVLFMPFSPPGDSKRSFLSKSRS